MKLTLPILPTWVTSAACTDADAPDFFPERTGGHVEHAKAVCARCPVALKCLIWGIDEEHGIWGGLTPDERYELRRESA